MTRKAGGSVADRSRGSRRVPDGVVSVSDPDTQRMKANLGYVQGYNAQAVVDEGQIVSPPRSPILPVTSPTLTR